MGVEMTRSTKAPAGVLQPYLPLTVENYVERRLSSPAAELVYAFRSAGAGACPFAVPDGCVDLAFGIGPTDVLVTMGGTVLTAKGWDFSGEREWVGCRFRPGEAVLPAGICPADLVDADIELDPADCDGRLVDALYQASDASARMDVLTHALLSHEAARGFSTHAGSRSVRALERYVREQILAAGGAASVAALAKEAGVSTRYLRRVFVEVHGISPKQFSLRAFPASDGAHRPRRRRRAGPGAGTLLRLQRPVAPGPRVRRARGRGAGEAPPDAQGFSPVDLHLLANGAACQPCAYHYQRIKGMGAQGPG